MEHKWKEWFSNPTAEDCQLRYRVPCRKGGFKYIIDREKRVVDTDGEVVFYGLFLDVTKEHEDNELIEMQKRLLEHEMAQKKMREESMRLQAMIQVLSGNYNDVLSVNVKDLMEICIFRIAWKLSLRVLFAIPDLPEI